MSPFTITDPNVAIAGTAADDKGVQSVQLTVVDDETGRYLQDNNTYASTYNTVNATLGTPNGTSTTWSYNMTVPGSGDYRVTAIAFDSVGQQDPSSTGATAGTCTTRTTCRRASTPTSASRSATRHSTPARSSSPDVL